MIGFDGILGLAAEVQVLGLISTTVWQRCRVQLLPMSSSPQWHTRWERIEN
jgi:hypothetical protein